MRCIELIIACFTKGISSIRMAFVRDFRVRWVCMLLSNIVTARRIFSLLSSNALTRALKARESLALALSSNPLAAIKRISKLFFLFFRSLISDSVLQERAQFKASDQLKPSGNVVNFGLPVVNARSIAGVCSEDRMANLSLQRRHTSINYKFCQ